MNESEKQKDIFILVNGFCMFDSFDLLFIKESLIILLSKLLASSIVIEYVRKLSWL